MLKFSRIIIALWIVTENRATWHFISECDTISLSHASQGSASDIMCKTGPKFFGLLHAITMLPFKAKNLYSARHISNVTEIGLPVDSTQCQELESFELFSRTLQCMRIFCCVSPFTAVPLIPKKSWPTQVKKTAGQLFQNAVRGIVSGKRKHEVSGIPFSIRVFAFAGVSLIKYLSLL